ncbi:MAG: AAA family ATPase, partial [Magnetococcales bacterium]|nr:AAA family ATPase [Magnetococcales bacterium]
IYYDFNGGRPVLNVGEKEEGGMRKKRKLRPDHVKHDRSILSQRSDPEQYPEITYLGNILSEIIIYREWNLTNLRKPQAVDLPRDFLEPDGSNLGLILNSLRFNLSAKNRFLGALRDLYDSIDDFDVKIEGGTIQVFLREGRFMVPATRLSDGTLRYLCLLAILCHPGPPPLVCIEEPELGLHPDILPTLADLLKEAAERCQIIVTTHSDRLVDAMTDSPEAVLVIEKPTNSTVLRRLDPDQLKPWLEKYRLGELWMRGGVGGKRW